MRPLRPMLYLACLLLTGETFAVGADDHQPTIQWSVADRARIEGHWQDSLYATLWRDPAFAVLRDRWQEQIQELRDDSGIDLPRLWLDFGGLNLSEHSDRLFPVLRIEAGEQAPELISSLQRDNWGPWIEKNSDEGTSWQSTSLGILIKRANGLIAAGQSPFLVPPTLPDRDDDVMISLHPENLELPGGVVLLPFPGSFISNLATWRESSYGLRIVPDGLLERLQIGHPGEFFSPVDHDQLARLPGNAMISAGIGIDGAALADFFEHDGLVSGELRALLSDLGLDRVSDNWRECALGLHGTWTFAVAPDAIAPIAVFSGPVSPITQALIQRLRGEEAAWSTPLADDLERIQLPDAPLPLFLAQSDQRFMISTSERFSRDWLGGATNGWSEGRAASRGLNALSEHDAEALAIITVEYPALLRTLIGLGGLLRNTGAIDPELIATTTPLLRAALPHVQPGYAWLAREETDAGPQIFGEALTPHGMVVILASAFWFLSRSDSPSQPVLAPVPLEADPVRIRRQGVEFGHREDVEKR